MRAAGALLRACAPSARHRSATMASSSRHGSVAGDGRPSSPARGREAGGADDGGGAEAGAAPPVYHPPEPSSTEPAGFKPYVLRVGPSLFGYNGRSPVDPTASPPPRPSVEPTNCRCDHDLTDAAVWRPAGTRVSVDYLLLENVSGDEVRKIFPSSNVQIGTRGSAVCIDAVNSDSTWLPADGCAPRSVPDEVQLASCTLRKAFRLRVRNAGAPSLTSHASPCHCSALEPGRHCTPPTSWPRVREVGAHAVRRPRRC